MLSLRDQGEGLTQSHKSSTEDGVTFMQLQCSCVYDGASLLNNITSVVLRMNKNKQLYIYIYVDHTITASNADIIVCDSVIFQKT